MPEAAGLKKPAVFFISTLKITAKSQYMKANLSSRPCLMKAILLTMTMLFFLMKTSTYTQLRKTYYGHTCAEAIITSETSKFSRYNLNNR